MTELLRPDRREGRLVGWGLLQIDERWKHAMDGIAFRGWEGITGESIHRCG